MSRINSVRNLQILYFSKKNKEIKKRGPEPPFIYTTASEPVPLKISTEDYFRRKKCQNFTFLTL